MFGPGTKKIKGQNIISVPIKDAKKELSLVKSLFEGANFVTIDAAEHDKKIAIILGLTHLVNLAFANILAKDDKISLTERMSGTTFKVQKILAESIMTESTELIETIISNPEIRRAAEEFWKDIGRLLTDIQEAKSEDITNYIRNIQEQLAKNSNLEESYKKLNTMVNAIEK
jgi:prephenate dehydrogenase